MNRLPLGSVETNMTVDPYNDPLAQWLLSGKTPKPRRDKRPPKPAQPTRHAAVFLDWFPTMPVDVAERYALAWIGANFWDAAEVRRWVAAGCQPDWAVAAAELDRAGVPPELACSRAMRNGRADDQWVELVSNRKLTAEQVADLAHRSGRIA